MMRGAVKAGALVLPALALLAPVRASSQETATWAGHGAAVLCIAVSPDGALAASGDANGEMRLWDAVKGVAVGAWPAGEGPVTAIAFSRDGKKFFLSVGQGEIGVWGVDGARTHAWPAHTAPILALSVSSNGRLLTSGGKDATRKIWSLAKGGMAAQWKKREDAAVLSAEFLADGKSIVFGSEDGTVRVCALSKKENEMAPACDVFKFDGCGLTKPFPDGRLALSACANGDLVRWDLGQGKDRATTKGGGSRINAMVISADGRLAATGGDDETVRLWDVLAMKPVSTLRGHRGMVTAVAFSPDGKVLLSAGEDRVIKSWDVQGELACAEKFAAGRAFLDGGKSAEALQAFEEAVACRPANVDFLNWLGSVYGDLGDHAKAVETLRKAAAMSRAAAWNFYLGRSLLAQGQLADAKAALVAGLTESLLNNRGMDRRGDIRVLMDKLEAYGKALDTANARLAEGRLEEARAAAEAALAQMDTLQAKALRDDAVSRIAAEARRSRNRMMGILGGLAAAVLGGGFYVWRRRRAAKIEAGELDAQPKDSPTGFPPPSGPQKR
ncbi:MAG: tetratricopeptide repeat protein [Elusimicrobia bacterium]|nr:tetratricopeptide repeat protein [Elusimicrobiota bacterium]